MSATTTQLLSSGEICKLRYDTVPIKSASANFSFYNNNSKMPNFELWHSCRKWGICHDSVWVIVFDYVKLCKEYTPIHSHMRTYDEPRGND